MSENETFRRVPRCCGRLSKPQQIGTPRWLHNAFGTIENEAASGGIEVFGHLASLLAAKGIPVYENPNETLRILREWWLAERQNEEGQAVQVSAWIDPRILRRVEDLEASEEFLLLPAFHYAVGQFTARFYPGSVLGWIATTGIHEGRRHLTALFYPLTSDGRLVRLEADKGAGRDATGVGLREAFGTAVRSRFISLTEPQKGDPERRKRAANQWLLLCRKAMGTKDPGDRNSHGAAVSEFDLLLGSPAFGKALGEEFEYTKTCYHMPPEHPRVPESDKVSARWNIIIDHWEAKRSEHKKVATETIRAHLALRDYQSVRGPYNKPYPPTEQEYFRLASGGLAKEPPSLRAALKARLAASTNLSSSRKALHGAYRESLAKVTAEADEVQYRTGYGLWFVELACAIAVRRPPRCLEGSEDLGPNTPQLVRSKAWIRGQAGKALNMAAKYEAKAHSPSVPTDPMSLLATPRQMSFPALGDPSQDCIAGGLED